MRGARRMAIVASQTSARLNEQIDEARPTAMPRFGETSTLGKDVGSKRGSFIVLS